MTYNLTIFFSRKDVNRNDFIRKIFGKVIFSKFSDFEVGIVSLYAVGMLAKNSELTLKQNNNIQQYVKNKATTVLEKLILCKKEFLMSKSRYLKITCFNGNFEISYTELNKKDFIPVEPSYDIKKHIVFCMNNRRCTGNEYDFIRCIGKLSRKIFSVDEFDTLFFCYIYSYSKNTFDDEDTVLQLKPLIRVFEIIMD